MQTTSVQMQLQMMVLCTYDVSGCTDSTANNYNADATIDDGSCDFSTPAPLSFQNMPKAQVITNILRFSIQHQRSVDLAYYAYPSVSNAPNDTQEYMNIGTPFDSAATIAPGGVYNAFHPSFQIQLFWLLLMKLMLI